ncbi:MAG: Na+-transporting NADH:ubiquinone oxidoreductase subunit C [Crocinitomix sp.]
MKFNGPLCSGYYIVNTNKAMIKERLLLFTICIVLISCNRGPDLSQNIDVHRIDRIIDEFGKLADSTYSDSTVLGTIMDFKTIDMNGVIESVEEGRAINLYYENIRSKKTSVFPIFEIRNTSKVILPVYGHGLWGKIWAKVVIDKATMNVLNIEFGHKSETPGIGGNINEPEFKTQFIGSKIYLSKNNFSLYKNDKKLIEGEQKIDGMSGATITSKAAIEMLNNDLLKYKPYLR